MREDEQLIDGALTSRIVGCAIEVHRVLGPGLLERAYRECLVLEMRDAGLATAAEVALPLVYRGRPVDAGLKADLVVEGRVIVEVAAVERLLPSHEARLSTCLKLSRLRVGLLMNFNVQALTDGLRRFVV